MKRRLGWFCAISVLLLGIFVSLAFALRQHANVALFPPKVERITVYVVDHGYHAGIVLPSVRLAEISKLQELKNLNAAISLFAFYEKIEIGWGEKNFYQYVPSAELSTFPHVLRALFLPGNKSVLHFVGINGAVKAAFSQSKILSIEISPEGLVQIARFLDAAFTPTEQGEVTPIGAGLYGPSAFFNSKESYHLFNLCNHWAGRLLAVAGVPFSPVESTVSKGLMFDLRKRAFALQEN
jgi:uncharacterized protein (TIGR02117 family)